MLQKFLAATAVVGLLFVRGGKLLFSQSIVCIHWSTFHTQSCKNNGEEQSCVVIVGNLKCVCARIAIQFLEVVSGLVAHVVSGIFRIEN